MWIAPLLRGHLPETTTFSLSQRWPLNTGLTVHCISQLYFCRSKQFHSDHLEGFNIFCLKDDVQVDKAGKDEVQVDKAGKDDLYVDKTEIRIYWWHKSTNSDELQDKNKTKSLNNDELKDKKQQTKNVESL
jgi:hypothetical protein